MVELGGVCFVFWAKQVLAIRNLFSGQFWAFQGFPFILLLLYRYYLQVANFLCTQLYGLIERLFYIWNL